MTAQDIINEILAKNPEVSQTQILEKVQTEKVRTGGLLDDQTLLRLIAAKYGVSVQQNEIHNDGVLSTSRLFAGLNNVTVAGHVIAVFPAKSFEGENQVNLPPSWLRITMESYVWCCGMRKQS